MDLGGLASKPQGSSCLHLALGLPTCAVFGVWLAVAEGGSVGVGFCLLVFPVFAFALHG